MLLHYVILFTYEHKRRQTLLKQARGAHECTNSACLSIQPLHRIWDNVTILRHKLQWNII